MMIQILQEFGLGSFRTRAGRGDRGARRGAVWRGRESVHPFGGCCRRPAEGRGASEGERRGPWGSSMGQPRCCGGVAGQGPTGVRSSARRAPPGLGGPRTMSIPALGDLRREAGFGRRSRRTPEKRTGSRALRGRFAGGFRSSSGAWRSRQWLRSVMVVLTQVKASWISGLLPG